MRYIAAVCEAARDPEKVRLGPSPRALIALMRACQALAAIRGRDYVIPDDIKAAALPVLPVLQLEGRLHLWRRPHWIINCR